MCYRNIEANGKLRCMGARKRQPFDVAIEVRGELCELKATLRTLLQMQIGTIIPISDPVELELFLGGDSVAKGRYGAFDGFKAMQFTKFREDKS